MHNANFSHGLSPRRAELTSFDQAYNVALRARRQTGMRQFIVATGNPFQPIRTSCLAPGNDEIILALVA
ncbi:hypothetical protein [Novosphingobium malaysiense]|uniref:Uncharacterized protein n=1 Tax=Novosphingobium malaysiense TaxID=1348853 RepID=A0A0B1ZGY8_9SPHN|nr:hypothetical protein [Novosphingobium malaysiense]KHK90371.1 hypothetical protein LK12_17410 [Novosphingobium malaysiense]